MPKPKSSPKSIIGRVQQEADQWHETRIGLIKKIEAYFKKRVVVFETSFFFDNGAIEDQDATMLEEVLLSSNIRKDLARIYCSL